MPIDARTAAGIAKLAGSLPPQSRLLELAMLAGNGLAAPLARVRANQAQREAMRAQRRFGIKSSEVARKLSEASAAEQLAASIDAEIARLSLDPPIPGEEQVALYGYVRDKGKPASDVVISLVGAAGETRAEARTADDGSFALTGAGPGPFGLLIGKGRSIVRTDEELRYTPAPRAYYRVIELAPDRAEKPERKPPPIELPERPQRTEQPDHKPYDGLTLNQALVRLAEDDRPLSRVVLSAGQADHGHVVGATIDRQSGAVTLNVAVGEGHSARLDALAVLMAQEPLAAGLDMATIEQARGLLKSAQLESLDDVTRLLDLSDDSIARKTGVRRGAQAWGVRKLLGKALSKLETR